MTDQVIPGVPSATTELALNLDLQTRVQLIYHGIELANKCVRAPLHTHLRIDRPVHRMLGEAVTHFISLEKMSPG